MSIIIKTGDYMLDDSYPETKYGEILELVEILDKHPKNPTDDKLKASLRKLLIETSTDISRSIGDLHKYLAIMGQLQGYSWEEKYEEMQALILEIVVKVDPDDHSS